MVKPTVGKTTIRAMRPNTYLDQSERLCRWNRSYPMTVSKVPRVAHTCHTEYNADQSRHTEGDQETHSPLFILRLVDRVSSQYREAPHHTENEVKRQREQKRKHNEQD